MDKEEEEGYFPKLFCSPWNSGEKHEKRETEGGGGSDLECEIDKETVVRDL